MACPPVCGNGVVEGDEDCDPGGTCIGGSAAGVACHVGDSTCTGGTCTTFGGQGCAANCTTEHDVPYPFKPGQLDGLNVIPGTSGVAIASDFLSIPLAFGGVCDAGQNVNMDCVADPDCPGGTCVLAQETLTIGKERNGVIPVVVKASSVRIPVIYVTTLGLATTCISGVAAKTCGGTFLLSDGKTTSPDCTPGYSDGDSVCTNADLPPCAFIHGDGNTAHGVIGCADGLDNIDVTAEQDSGGSSGACAPPNTCPPTLTLSGHGPSGSAQLLQTLGITTNGDYFGQVYCPEPLPGGIFSAALTSPAVTGTATAVVLNANGADGTNLGPVSVTGAPFSCAALAQGSAAGAGLVQAFTFVHLDTVGDVAITEQYVASGTVPPTPSPTPLTACVGDCDGNSQVTIAELLTLVNIALGNAQPSACLSGVPNGATADIALIIQTVNSVLHGCG